MKNWSLRNKLLLFSLGMLVLALGGISWVSISSMQHTSDDVVEGISESAGVWVSDLLKQSSDRISDDVGDYLNRAFDTPLMMRSLVQPGVDNAQERFSRDQVQQIARQALAAAPGLLATYIQFEPDEFDQQDALMVGSGDHTTDIGTLETYWVREGSTLKHYVTEDPSSKYSTALNELGDREAEWYLCSYEKNRACIIQPYPYEIEPGKEVLMTSLVVPIQRDGRFIGVAGADIDLPRLQSLMEQRAAGLFNGKANLHLLNEKNRVVASTEYSDKLAGRFRDVAPELFRAVSTQKDQMFKFDEHLVYHHSIRVDAPGVDWQLVMTVPEAVAFASVNTLKEGLREDAMAALSKLILFAVASIAVGAVLVLLVVGSITRPLNQMRERIFNLSSSEGDLTQTLQIDNHKELIEISQGINRFIGNLREMILSLQEQSLQVQKQTNLLSEATSVTTETIARQTAETDSVATAMEEMASTSAEVARLASTSAEGTQVSEKILHTTQSSFDHSVSQVQAIAEAMLESSDRIMKVADRSHEINAIVSTIADIAEQTNLLALNAAIEAARAGEQGRGFAVVADEVRNLAASTQKSTEEINDLVKRLQSNVQQAVEQINGNKARTESTTTSIAESVESLRELAAQVNQIADNTVQVASAAEEQSQVNNEISRSVNDIGETAKALSEQAASIDGVRRELTQVVGLLDEQLGRLKV